MDTQVPSAIVPNILIVDDTPANLKLLSAMLKDRGYKARAVPSGERALEAARLLPPDLILLDVNMPGMDGFEVCERLKEDPLLKDIPILFISALADTSVKVKAFRVGGEDYITKPFQFDEVEARVRTQLELHRQRRELKHSYEQLRKLESLRDNLTHMVVHDMRSHLTAIMWSLELAAESDSNTQYLQEAQKSTSKLADMMTTVLDVSRLESGNMPVRKTSCSVTDIAASVVDGFRSMSGTRRLLYDGEPAIGTECDADLVRRVIENLLANALKFTPANGEIKVSVTQIEDHVRVAVEDTGRGIPPEYHETIFEKFQQANSGAEHLGTGLGLAFCKLAVSAHGGTIGVESELGSGSTFWFCLPCSRPSQFDIPNNLDNSSGTVLPLS